MFLVLSLSLRANVFSWDNEKTHKDLSIIAAENSLMDRSKGDYLRSIDLNEGLNQRVKWKNSEKAIKEWLQEGADKEDAGNWKDAVKGQARFNNHFYNPLAPMSSAGLDDVIVKTIPNPALIPPFITVYWPVSGEAAPKWAHDNEKQDTAVEGNWTWGKTKTFYYKALTSRTDAERQSYFAQTFKGLGHQMHLLQDMAVSAHVRNDGHPEESIQYEMIKRGLPVGDLYFENWAKKYPDKISAFAANPVFPSIDLTENPYNLTPIAQFYDSEQYTAGAYPDTSPSWGIAEYTNANFVSYDTIFTDYLSATDKHYFPYPSYNTACYNIIESENIGTGKKERYLSKTCQGEPVARFAAASPLFPYLWPLYKGALKLDSSTHRDYAEKLVPRAVGYSAALLNYFFRGRIRLEPAPGNPGAYVIRNNSDENMRGIFSLYYDNLNGDRILIKKNLGYGLLTINAKQSSDPVVFDMPTDAKEPGKYILVFQGTIGAESGAVAGFVTSRIFQITPPSQFIYSMVDAGSAKPEFTDIKVKIKNISTETMQNGTLQAVAKYKKTTDDPNFLYAVSTPKTGISLGTDATEFSFDFRGSPIPINATDLYLEIIFKGIIGTEQDATAIGIKDISEPTPIDLFNSTDRICLNSKWYISGSPAAIAQVDKDNDGNANDWNEWDVYPHIMRNIYIKISSPTDPQTASPAVNNFALAELDAGQFRRTIYILTDNQFKYSVNTVWARKGEDDAWGHSTMTYMHDGTAVKNQIDHTSDPDVCRSEIFCSNTVHPGDHFVRGSNMWWGGGLVFIDSPYPASSSCQGYE